MTAWIVTWALLVLILVGFFVASNGYRSLWLHLHFPLHRQRMRRAELCLEAAEHWHLDEFVRRRFISQAYQLCDGCGCPPDLWPAQVLRIHVGVW